jgi:hypothetical protein
MYPLHVCAFQLVSCGFPNHIFLYSSQISLFACPAHFTFLILNSTTSSINLNFTLFCFLHFLPNSAPSPKVCDELLALLTRILEAETSNRGLHTDCCAVFVVPVSCSRQRPSDFLQKGYSRSFPHPSHIIIY